MPSAFRWTTFDLTGRLQPGWQRDIRAVAADADFREFPRTPVLSREAPDVLHIARGRVHADQVRRRLPWLYNAYRHEFLELAREAFPEAVYAARDDRYGIVLNVQRGTEMRFECHIDSNPLTGLLFCTDHAAGGEFVIAHDATAADIATVERDCSVIKPHRTRRARANGSCGCPRRGRPSSAPGRPPGRWRPPRGGWDPR